MNLTSKLFCKIREEGRLYNAHLIPYSFREPSRGLLLLGREISAEVERGAKAPPKRTVQTLYYGPKQKLWKEKKIFAPTLKGKRKEARYRMSRILGWTWSFTGRCSLRENGKRLSTIFY